MHSSPTKIGKFGVACTGFPMLYLPASSFQRLSVDPLNGILTLAKLCHLRFSLLPSTDFLDKC